MADYNLSKTVSEIESALDNALNPDTTLSQSGKPADAKAVGDALNGAIGQPGADGYSPTVSVTKNGDTTTIKITDKDGTKTATIKDGATGEPGADGAPGATGKDGTSPIATFTEIAGGYRISITDKTGTKSVDIKNGTNGENATPEQIAEAVEDYFEENKFVVTVWVNEEDWTNCTADKTYAEIDEAYKAGKKVIAVLGGVDPYLEFELATFNIFSYSFIHDETSVSGEKLSSMVMEFTFNRNGTIEYKTDSADIPTKTSQLTNDSGFITLNDIPEIPAVPTNVSAFNNDVGYALKSELPNIPVQSVNGKTGAVQLSASDVGAKPDSYNPTYADVGAEKAGTVNTHDTSPDAHRDIRTAANDAKTTATNALNKADELESRLPSVVQNAGQSTEAVMSQKAVTDLVNAAINGDSGDYEIVDSVAEMTDTTKSYILKSTGTVWSWLPVETETFKETTEKFNATANNPAYDGKSLSTSGMSDGSTYVSTPYIDLYEYGFPCTLHLNGLEWVTETPTDKIRVKAYNENKEYIMLYSTAISGSGYWPYAQTGNITIVDSSHANVAFPSAYYINTSKAVRYLQFCAIGTWAQADISVTYMKKEIVKGEPEWQDTGITVTDNTDFSLVNASVKGFIDNVSYADDDYSVSSVGNYCAKDYYRQDLPLPVVLNWNSDPMAASYAVSLGDNDKFSAASATIYYSNTNRIEIYHLLPNKTFYYKVTAILFSGNKKVLKEGSFTTQANKTRMLNIDGIQNVRDVGGYSTRDGRTVKYGLLFRGSAMDEEATRYLRISGNGAHELLKVGIKTDLDLRYGHDESPLGVDYIKTSSGYENYAKAFTVKTQRTNFKNLFESIVGQLEVTGEEAANGEVAKPVYIHCQGGCDRTGTLIFQLLGLLGVSESDLAKEYELSSFSPIGFTRLRSGEKYSGMIAQLKNNYTGNTIYEKLVSFATKANDDTETGGCGIDSALITTFQNLMLDGEPVEPEGEKYTNIFDTSASGFDNQSSKFYTNWLPYNPNDNNGAGTIYHFKGLTSSSDPYKLNFATDANGSGATSQIYANATNGLARVKADYDSSVTLVQHFLAGYNYCRFECRETLPANLIITANENIVD